MSVSEDTETVNVLNEPILPVETKKRRGRKSKAQIAKETAEAEIKQIEEETIKETKTQSKESVANVNEEGMRLIEEKLNSLTLRFDQHITTNHSIINDIHEQLVIVKKMIKEREQIPPVLTQTRRIELEDTTPQSPPTVQKTNVRAGKHVIRKRGARQQQPVTPLKETIPKVDITSVKKIIKQSSSAVVSSTPTHDNVKHVKNEKCH